MDLKLKLTQKKTYILAFKLDKMKIELLIHVVFQSAELW